MTQLNFISYYQQTLSELDIKEINKLYGCDPVTKKILKSQPPTRSTTPSYETSPCKDTRPNCPELGRKYSCTHYYFKVECCKYCRKQSNTMNYNRTTTTISYIDQVINNVVMTRQPTRSTTPSYQTTVRRRTSSCKNTRPNCADMGRRWSCSHGYFKVECCRYCRKQSRIRIKTATVNYRRWTPKYKQSRTLSITRNFCTDSRKDCAELYIRPEINCNHNNFNVPCCKFCSRLKWRKLKISVVRTNHQIVSNSFKVSFSLR